MMSSAGSAHTYRSEDTHVHISITFIHTVWRTRQVKDSISFLSPGQWEEFELEAVHGGANLITG